MNNNKREQWLAYQKSKSILFHQKLHEWQMLEIAQQIEEVDGAKLVWDKEGLGITDMAWNRVIHRGIKPITIFAHPSVLTNISRAVSYYRMLAMVSQKSMANVGLAVNDFESGKASPNHQRALNLAQHLNVILSLLIEADEELDAREFDIWRGMGAGTQAQGSSHNNVGKLAEASIQSIIRVRLAAKSFAEQGIDDRSKNIKLADGRRFEFRGDPDIALFSAEGRVQVIVEVKGGIDPAAALERLGAMLKSFGHAREAEAKLTTILILQATSLTTRTQTELQNNPQVDLWFTVEELSKVGEPQERFFAALGI